MSQHPNTKEHTKSTELTEEIKERVNVLLLRILRLRLLCGAGGYPPNVLQPTEAYCTNPALVFLPSSPEALHIRRRERPLLARGGTGKP
jgi:hypothetical protein